MSRETWEIVQESGIKNVEIQLALQCAPLIAGLKISNLFQISIEDYIQVLKILKNSRIMIYPLGVKGNTIALLFIPEEITRRISRSGKSKRIVKGIWLFLYFDKGNFSNVPEALSGISSKKMSFST